MMSELGRADCPKICKTPSFTTALFEVLKGRRRRGRTVVLWANPLPDSKILIKVGLQFKRFSGRRNASFQAGWLPRGGFAGWSHARNPQPTIDAFIAVRGSYQPVPN
jgi:hypothetical protein